MIRQVEVKGTPGLEEYRSVPSLSGAVEELAEAARSGPERLEERTVWMVNSTAQGGGVAEMLPTQISLLRDLGLSVEWAVLQAERPEFFALTKRIHNHLHGEGEGEFDAADRRLFEEVSRRNAEGLAARLEPDDLVVVHDPQPMPLAAALRERGADVRALWRCHVGLDQENAATRAAWSFLAPYAPDYEAAVFTAPEYVPDFFRDRCHLIYPAIDPLAEKNRELRLRGVLDVLGRSGLLGEGGGGHRGSYPESARRLGDDGKFEPAADAGDTGLLERPVATQISRWDRLKGYRPLLEAFVRMKGRAENGNGRPPREREALRQSRLVMAGPDPDAVSDDPEGQEVLEEIRSAYLALDERHRRDVAVVALPMESRERNALMVNALQRSSTAVIQNSLREGFGLTITEAMWKARPVLSNRRACGPRHQVRHGRDGLLISDPEDPGELSEALARMLTADGKREEWGRSGRRRAHEEFLVLSQLRRWLSVLSDLA